MNSMQAANRFAFKEWAVVCAALSQGRQSLILRKGGLHEGREGFRIEHGEFWLFPTQYHQQPGDLIAEAHPLLEQVRETEPPAGSLRIADYAVVQEVVRIENELLLPRLAGLHVWSERTVHDRFHYRQPGLFALMVRVYRASEPLLLPDSPHFAGCRTWVELPVDLPTAGLAPVVDDSAASAEFGRIHRALSESSVA